MAYDEYSQTKTNSTNNSMAAPACATFEPLLTAAFDSEANGEEMQSAHAHLDECARCAGLWRGWKSTRALLHAAPAPAAPRLLSRALLASRFGASRETSFDKTDATSPQVEYSRDALLLEELLLDPNFDSGYENGHAFEPPLQKFFVSAAPPPHLQAEILKRTVNAKRERDARHAAWSQSLAALFVPRPLRWSGALVVPAVTVWLLIASRPPASIETQTIGLQQEKSTQVTPSVTAQSRIAQNFKTKTLTESVKRTMPVAPRAITRVENEEPAVASRPAMSLVSITNDTANAPSPRHAADAGRPAERVIGPTAIITPPSIKSPSPRVARVRRAIVTRVGLAHFSPRLNSAGARDSGLSPRRLLRAGLQVTSLDATPRFDEAEADDFGRVFEDYRASFVADAPDEDEEYDDEPTDDEML